MQHINIEFKARATNLKEQEEKLLLLNPRFSGTDKQVDTYFMVPEGRLKLREGNIENSLIFYRREDIAGDKTSKVLLYEHTPNPQLKAVLKESLGVLKVVSKSRKIYFIDNVKFHFDTVEGLGEFVEVEVIDKDGTIGEEALKEQCRYYREYLGVADADLQQFSYSDLLDIYQNY